jgi:hypothetical protein
MTSEDMRARARELADIDDMIDQAAAIHKALTAARVAGREDGARIADRLETDGIECASTHNRGPRRRATPADVAKAIRGET